jgi:alkylation response protein AidB-like acyl-CoA dehydrogenase
MTEAIDLKAIAGTLGPIFAARAGDLDDTDGFATENYQDLREHRVFSALVPMELGGGGATHSEVCAFVRQLARHCGSTALSLSMHQHLVAAAVANDRAGRPGRELLEKVADGRTVLVSTGANDWLESNGSAQRVEGGFLVSAVKPFASGSPAGDIMVTSAAYDDPDEGAQVIHFPLSLKADDVTLLGDWKTMGMRATGSQTIKLDGVFVADSAIVLQRSRTEYHAAFSTILAVSVPLIMSAYTGVAEAAATLALVRAKGRAGDPVAPTLAGEMENLLTMTQIACNDLVRLANNLEFEPTTELASQILVRKTICSNNAVATIEKALEFAGGGAFFRKFGLERLLRDVHACRFHPLPEKRQQLFSGRLALGLDPVEFSQISQRPASVAA